MTISPPSLSEMKQFLEARDGDALQFGVKGMRWGFRRTDAQLGKGKNRVKDDDGNDVGGIATDSRSTNKQLSKMGSGEAVVLDAGDGSKPKIYTKQKDGSFKETTISADAASVMRTLNKDPSEMSTREINEAVNRMQKIEAYNKIFAPTPNPHAALQAKVDAMELEVRYKQALAKAHPPKPSPLSRVKGLIDAVSPMYALYQKVNGDPKKGTISEQLMKLLNTANKATGGKTKAPKPNKKTYSYVKNPNYKKPKKQKDTVYNITTPTPPPASDTYDYGNPFIPQLGSGS